MSAGAPRRLVLLGHPVAHSLSPALQNAALASLGLPLRYEALDVPPEALDATLDALVAEGAAGNVTLPHKIRVATRSHTLTARARRAEAVNVFWTEDGRLHGDNTDIPAFALLAERVLGRRPAGLRIALLGAGGASTAVLSAVEAWPETRVHIYNRSAARAEALAARFPVIGRVAATAHDAVRDASLVVNATSLGLQDVDDFPASLTHLPSDAAVIDLVYRPHGTAWVRAAAAAGHRAADGMEMLLEQGALAFERWMGVAAPRAVMREALVRFGAAPE